MLDKNPTPEEHLELVVNPDVRDAYHQRTIEEGDLHFTGRGRKRPFIPVEQIANPENLLLDDELVFELGALLDRRKAPLFDNFTQHCHIEPTRQSIELYVESGNRKNMTRPVEGESKRDHMRKKQRQTKNIADNLQHTVFHDMIIARSRREALRITQYLIDSGRPLDPGAAKKAAEAVESIGYGLMANPDMTEDVGGYETALKTVVIGMRAGDDPLILRTHMSLLRLAQREQRKREGYWSVRYVRSKEILGDLLRQQDKLDLDDLEKEIASYQKIAII